MPASDATVLGIDAAWTASEPSGVALLQRAGERWRCVRVAPSYAAFCHSATWAAPVMATAVDAATLLATCRSLTGGSEPRVVAVDMPLSTRRIEARREADNSVSRAFGGRCKCGTHSPSPQRPGATGRRLHEGFAAAGYDVATTAHRTLPALLEVYPHVALLGLTDRAERLPYKACKTGTYWPGQELQERKDLLLSEWQGILNHLRRRIGSIELPLPTAAADVSFRHLKRFEDALDALVCAWTAVEFAQGSACALGDETAAIWIPECSRRHGRWTDAS